ncbi:MAG: chemotaxis protein CheA [Pseudomonadales bacterium]|nr:chemotaxis protein CheA [Pseudomonadales bacterium]
MSFGDDEEILQDFLVEAAEILEQLSEQLVLLERQPDDAALLNAIFRGFHTVKGGAGFLQLTPLVDCCHVTENLFDKLRNGELQVNSELMDIVLQVLDVVNAMFEQLRGQEAITPADPALLELLQQLVAGETLARESVDTPVMAEPASTQEMATGDEITEAEFEALLDSLQADDDKASTVAAEMTTSPEIKSTAEIPQEASDSTKNAQAGDDEISDDEFEALLDTLHGPGAHKGLPEQAEKQRVKPAPVVSQPPQEMAVNKENQSVGEATVRVDTKRLDEIMNMVGELVLVRNRLVRIGLDANDEVLSKALANLDLVTADLQTSVMKTRMQPIKKVFGRFPRVVRDLARNLGKEVTLELHGEETDLDKNLVEALADPLVHLVRNAVDHGIELPDARERNGKSRQGSILLAAEQEGDHILLSIADDGNGMDPDVLRNKAVQKGILDRDAADRLSAAECFDLIFAPGFSTKTEVSDVSGRGVGMDVVKTRIAQLNGAISIDSKAGRGTRIEIKVPLTLAIMPTLMVMIGDQTFALPLASVNEIFDLDMQRTNVVDGQQVVTVRDKALPLYHLRRWLVDASYRAESDCTANVVIVSIGTQRIGFVVDHLVGQEEVVIKPLGRMLHGTPGMAGATITGDGRIAIILDIPGLLKRYAG